MDASESHVGHGQPHTHGQLLIDGKVVLERARLIQVIRHCLQAIRAIGRRQVPGAHAREGCIGELQGDRQQLPLGVAADDVLPRVRRHAKGDLIQGRSEIRQVLIQAEPRPNGCLPVAPDVPGKSDARAEILQARVAHHRAVAPRLSGIREVEEAALDTVPLSGDSLELIAEAQVQRQPGGRPDVVLRIEAPGFV